MRGLRNSILGICTVLLSIVLLQPEFGHAVQSQATPERSHASSIEQAASSPSVSTEMNNSIAEWVQNMSEQAGFESWKGATWTTFPLGPGQHGWVVIMEHEKQEVGYLIVAATQDGGFIVSEYGLGGYPLFSLQSLYDSLQKQQLLADHVAFGEFHELIAHQAKRHYYGSVEALWQVKIDQVDYWLDAKTTELYPPMEIEKKQAEFSGIPGLFDPHTVRLETMIEAPAFDPFEQLHWMFKQGTSPPLADLKAALQAGERITYVRSIGAEAEVTIALAVTGLHEWNDGNAFISLDHAGTRFLPYFSLTSNGLFHIAP